MVLTALQRRVSNGLDQIAEDLNDLVARIETVS